MKAYDLEKVTRLHKLAAVAVADSRSLDRSVYKADYSEFHSPGDGLKAKCAVCFAGAVMAGIIEPYESMSPDTMYDHDLISKHASNKIKALDHLRTGDYVEAVETFYACASVSAHRRAMRVLREHTWNIDMTGHCPGFRGWASMSTFLQHMESKVIPVLKELDL